MSKTYGSAFKLGHPSIVFNVSDDCKRGWVINGAWDMLIEEFKPPYIRFRVARYPEQSQEHIDVRELDSEYAKEYTRR